jgi:hypothetical protein
MTPFSCATVAESAASLVGVRRSPLIAEARRRWSGWRQPSDRPSGLSTFSGRRAPVGTTSAGSPSANAWVPRIAFPTAVRPTGSRRPYRRTSAPAAMRPAAARKVSLYAAMFSNARGSCAGSKPTSRPTPAAAPTTNPRPRRSGPIRAARMRSSQGSVTLRFNDVRGVGACLRILRLPDWHNGADIYRLER